MHRPRTLAAALVIGLGAGLAARAAPPLAGLLATLQPLATLWVRALQMTLVPLIFAMVANGVGTAVASGRGGRLVGTVIGAAVAVCAGAIAIAAALTEGVLALWPLPPHPLAGLIGGDVAAPAVPSVVDQILAIIPTNPVTAAAQNQIFPLVVFALVFGLAIARLKPDAAGHPPRLPAMMAELAHAMMVLVDWILLAAPAGIFLLTAGVVAGAGLAIASLLLHYVVIVALYSLLAIALCYVAVGLCRAMPLGRFAAGILPAQTMAMGTMSSLATTPAMLAAAIERLGLPEALAGTVIPLAVSIFRVSSVGATTVALVLSVHAFDLHPALATRLLAGLANLLSVFGMPGLPGPAVVYAADAPPMQLLGVPLTIIPLYIAVVSLPDPLITAANVTGDLTLATIINRFVRLAPDTPPAA